MWVRPIQFSSAVQTNVDFFCRGFERLPCKYLGLNIVSIYAANSSDIDPAIPI